MLPHASRVLLFGGGSDWTGMRSGCHAGWKVGEISPFYSPACSAGPASTRTKSWQRTLKVAAGCGGAYEYGPGGKTSIPTDPYDVRWQGSTPTAPQSSAWWLPPVAG